MRATRRSAPAAVMLVGLVTLGGCGWLSETAAPESAPSASARAQVKTKSTRTAPPKATTTAIPSAAPATTAASTRPSDERRLRLVRSIGGQISPKSVVASGRGLVFAQNMMYRHSVTVYGSDGTLVRTIPDSVRLADFGVSGHPGVSKGAPVEAAFSPDGRYAYVSNYSMYGSGFGPEGSDTCTPSSAAAAGVPKSYVYRISTATLKIDKVYKVGRVPKYVAVTPDGSKLLVTDWCSWDLRIIDLASGRTLASPTMGAYPRGIVVTPDSKRAYVAVMGSSHLAVVDLGSGRITRTIEVGSAPRHVVISPDGSKVYVTLNGANQVVKVNTVTGATARVNTGAQPRSMAIAPDGRALYVVNYKSNTVSKVRTSDMKVIQSISTGQNPIGITYDPTTNDVWAAIYTGSILVLQDR